MSSSNTTYGSNNSYRKIRTFEKALDALKFESCNDSYEFLGQLLVYKENIPKGISKDQDMKREIIDGIITKVSEFENKYWKDTVDLTNKMVNQALGKNE